jgi:acyl-coenzyme A thioesterase PaaI-like protein
MIPMIIATQNSLETVRDQAHPRCVGCSRENKFGLGLEFRLRTDNGVEADFNCDLLYQGYTGFLHGGIASLLVDSAMANCLFAHQIKAVTARLIVRYLLPIKAGKPMRVQAWMREYEPPLYVLESKLVQESRVVVQATAKFINQD